MEETHRARSRGRGRELQWSRATAVPVLPDGGCKFSACCLQRSQKCEAAGFRRGREIYSSSQPNEKPDTRTRLVSQNKGLGSVLSGEGKEKLCIFIISNLGGLIG